MIGFSWRNWPLATKLTLAMTGLVVVAVAGVTLLSLRRQQQSYRQELEQQAELLLDALTIATHDALYFQDVESIQDILQLLSVRQVLVSGRVYEKEGLLVADAKMSNQLVYSFEPDPLGKRLVQSKKTVFMWNPDRLIAGKAIVFGRRRVGAVSVGLSTEPLKEKTIAVRNQGLFVVLVASAIGISVARLLSRSIAEPLREMTAATESLAAGDLTYKIAIPSGDELAVLASAFNSMTDRLRELIASLEQRAEALRHSEAQLREKAQLESLIHQLANQVRNSLNLETILATSVQEIYSLLHIECCQFFWCVMTPSPAWDCVQEAKNTELPSRLGCYSLEKEDILSQKIFKQETIRLDDIAATTDPEVQWVYEFWEYAAMLAVPIMTPNGKLGVVCCSQFSSPRHWKDSEVDLLQAACDQLAIAISQAELYTQAKEAEAIASERARELELALNQLKQTQSKLVHSEKMASLGQLVAGVAHEINNPVSFIYGNIDPALEYASDLFELMELYRQHYPEPASEIEEAALDMDIEFAMQDFPKLLNSMKVGAERIRDIVESLRNFSRLDESEMKFANLNEGLDSTLMILQKRLKAPGNYTQIKIVKEYDSLPKVECYPGQLNQVFMNVIANAIDALDQYRQKRNSHKIERTTPTIWIKTIFLEPDRVAISIKDNGPGINQEVKHRLFDPFFTTKPVGQGTGLGLSISYQIVVERHKGQLHCISCPGRGTEFLIEIPADKRESV